MPTQGNLTLTYFQFNHFNLNKIIIMTDTVFVHSNGHISIQVFNYGFLQVIGLQESLYIY